MKFMTYTQWLKQNQDIADLYETCPICNGIGVVDCPNCLGSFLVSHEDCDCDLGQVKCDMCNGDGEVKSAPLEYKRQKERDATLIAKCAAWIPS